jgi:hypothetical protein
VALYEQSPEAFLLEVVVGGECIGLSVAPHYEEAYCITEVNKPCPAFSKETQLPPGVAFDRPKLQ